MGIVKDDTIDSNNMREDACLELLKDICNTYTLETMHNKVYSDEVQGILQHNYDLFKSSMIKIHQWKYVSFLKLGINL